MAPDIVAANAGAATLGQGSMSLRRTMGSSCFASAPIVGTQ